MNILIIEDEKISALDLQSELLQINNQIKNIDIRSSITDSIDYINNNHVDIIFSDIELNDGLCFEIFKQIQVNVPIIFCTAYKDYAFEAYKNNGIDYILKPFNRTELSRAFDKACKYIGKTDTFKREQKVFIELEKNITKKEKQNAKSLLVYFRDQIIPVNILKVRIIQYKNHASYIYLDSGQKYESNYSLDKIQAQLDPEFFYRVSRSIIIHRDEIKSMQKTILRKLIINTYIKIDEEIHVGKLKSKDFLEWFTNHSSDEY